ncbi:MAG: RecX family transcriptional regulator [Prevotella sp.]|nr:RecX family transcriptional regulator [Prevotella sp.]
MKQLTEQEALFRLTALCSQAEHCSYEMSEKMRKWQISDEAQARIMQHLISERYIDDERYCRYFVKDKIRYNKWGRRKVEQALWAKHIDSDISKAILDEVDDEEYINILRPMIKNRRKQMKDMSEYEANARLMRWAVGRGFTFDIIRQCIDGVEELEDDAEEN